MQRALSYCDKTALIYSYTEIIKLQLYRDILVTLIQTAFSYSYKVGIQYSHTESIKLHFYREH